MRAKKYKTIVVDPPWDYGVVANNHPTIGSLPDRQRRGGRRIKNEWRSSVDAPPIQPKTSERVIAAKDMPYVGEGVYAVTDGYAGVMNVKEIKKFSLVKDLSDDAALCFLWTTNKFLRDSYSILESWGFKNLPLTLIWDKGMGPQFPLSPSYNAEFVVVGRRGKFDGKLWLDTKSFPTCFNVRPGKHSEKPAFFYNLLRRVTRMPRVDLFARRRHLGFDAWGNQVDPWCADNDMFQADYPPTQIVNLGTGELHIEDWEDWENKQEENEVVHQNLI